MLPEWRPEPHNEEYYFVSYAHEDYKAVYKDIFSFQSKGINIWYDAGMPPTQSWKEIAEMFICKYACKGVIFYISEFSILSEAIHEEMEYVRKSGKEFIVINLPIAGDYKFQGESWKGRTDYSALKLLKILQCNNKKEIDKGKNNFVSKILNDDVRYVEYGVLIENKIDELSKLCRSSLFDFEINSNVIYVRTLNDFNVREIIKDDFVFIDKSNRKHNVQEIGDCALANCKFLETIEAPPTLNYLGCYVFAKCYNLNFVKMNGLIGIGDGAFFRCSHLTEISFPHLTKVGHFSFYYCVNLLRINAPSLEEIWDYAFCGCDLIKSASFKKVRIIGNFAFDSCTGLKKIYLKEVKEIWSYSFCNCWGLKDIYYEGTIQQWVLVNKHNNWDYGTGNYIVHCLDGNIVKEKV